MPSPDLKPFRDAQTVLRSWALQNQVADASLLTSDVNNLEQYKDDDLFILQMSKYDFGMLARAHE